MAQGSGAAEDLLGRAVAGDERALAELFELHRVRMERMVRLRLDKRLHGRLDPADVVQESYLVLVRRFPEYVANPLMPFHLWLRRLTGQTMAGLHRWHLGAKMRAAGQEQSIHQGEMPQASAESLAEFLLGRLTSASRAVIRAETQHRVQQALDRMEPMDREVLVLRHLEELSNVETALVLEIQESAASKRYLRALKRLKEIMSGFSENVGEAG